jgi:acyl-CoA synthetase (AMP-forming)/AMP-acid ligase II
VFEDVSSTCSSALFSLCDLVAVEKVTQSLRASLPSYVCPSVWISIDNLPSSTSGKLDRKALMTKLETLSQEEYLELVLDGDMDGEEETETT